MDKTKPKIYAALPAMNEMENMEAFLKCFFAQDYPNTELYVCVNQPDDWWEKEGKASICENNLQTLDYLRSVTADNIHILDRCSRGNGWKGKDFGVGQARKTLMDGIAENANDGDIIVSMDADTHFNPNYFTSIAENFQKHPKAVALSVPYYHPLNDDTEANKQILHYEIYMRYYALNLWRTGSPYSFTAIGSAMALPVWAYKAIGGITPHKSGEDFYFLQKLRKYGNVLSWNREKVYPAARFSDRVFFGTGPAMIKGNQGGWDSYPIYPFRLFDMLKAFFEFFPQLFEKDIETPLDEFISGKFGNKNIWKPLRGNSKTKEQFVKACHQKFDALRTLQYLKWENSKNPRRDENNLLEYLNYFCSGEISAFSFDVNSFDFMKSSIGELDEIRDMLVRIEEEVQINNQPSDQP
ncbi:MAG: glycosyltransferase [Chlorobi bacterium]|nr:glycosyltransferase [Chlorobiota bacterium]